MGDTYETIVQNAEISHFTTGTDRLSKTLSANIAHQLYVHAGVELSSHQVDELYVVLQHHCVGNEGEYKKLLHAYMLVQTPGEQTKAQPNETISIIGYFLRVSLGSADHVVMWLKLLLPLSTSYTNLEYFNQHSITPVILGIMSAYSGSEEIHRHACALLKNITKYIPHRKNKALIREVGCELLVLAIVNHISDVGIIENACSALCNVVNTVQTMVQKETYGADDQDVDCVNRVAALLGLLEFTEIRGVPAMLRAVRAHPNSDTLQQCLTSLQRSLYESKNTDEILYSVNSLPRSQVPAFDQNRNAPKPEYEVGADGSLYAKVNKFSDNLKTPNILPPQSSDKSNATRDIDDTCIVPLDEAMNYDLEQSSVFVSNDMYDTSDDARSPQYLQQLSSTPSSVNKQSVCKQSYDGESSLYDEIVQTASNNYSRKCQQGYNRGHEYEEVEINDAPVSVTPVQNSTVPSQTLCQMSHTYEEVTLKDKTPVLLPPVSDAMPHIGYSSGDAYEDISFGGIYDLAELQEDGTYDEIAGVIDKCRPHIRSDEPTPSSSNSEAASVTGGATEDADLYEDISYVTSQIRSTVILNDKTHEDNDTPFHNKPTEKKNKGNIHKAETNKHLKRIQRLKTNATHMLKHNKNEKPTTPEPILISSTSILCAVPGAYADDAENTQRSRTSSDASISDMDKKQSKTSHNPITLVNKLRLGRKKSQYQNDPDIVTSSIPVLTNVTSSPARSWNEVLVEMGETQLTSQGVTSSSPTGTTQYKNEPQEGSKAKRKISRTDALMGLIKGKNSNNK